MNAVSRRSLLRSTALIPVAVVMAGCQPGQSFSQVATDLGTIADALAAILPTIASLTGASASIVANISGAMDTVRKIASSVASATGSAAADLVSQAGAALTGALAVVSGLSLPSGLSNVFAAITALLPAIEQAAGIVVSMVHPAARFAVAAAVMTPDQARAVLIAAAR